MVSNRAGISRSTPEEKLDERLPEDIDLFVSGHTHKVHRFRHSGIEVVNVGSVGSPFDEDERAAYGRFEFRDGHWKIELVRIPYDRAMTDRAFEDSGFIEGGGPLARVIYEEWKQARLLIGDWRERFQDAVLAGDISLQRSVDTFLAGLK
jgi:hypothetical protein